MRKTIALTITCITVGLLLSGCGNTLQGAGEDIEKAGQSIQRTFD